VSSGVTTSTRERILHAAIHLFQARGYHAVGVNEILERADAPKGSLYHHFPNGKGEIAREAIAWLAGTVSKMIEDGFARGKSPGSVLVKVAHGMAGWLEQSQWREGSLIASMAQESVPDDPAIHEAVRAAYDCWRTAMKRELIARGTPTATAGALSSLGVACLEGGLILARVDQSNKPLVQAAEQVAVLMDGSG
jgi:AcrR family transcriptional regulator